MKPQPVAQNPRIAIVEFDDQTSGGERWVGQAMSLILVDSLLSHPELSPAVVKDTEGWRTLGVGRFISGNYRRQGTRIRIEARLVDAVTSRVLAQVEAFSAENQLSAFVAQKLIPGLLGWSANPTTAPDGAWGELARAFEKPGSASLQEFVSSHAGFAPAYPLLAERLIQEGRKQQAEELATRLKGESYYSAQMHLILADTPDKRLAALGKLATFRPQDPTLLSEVGRRARELENWTLAARQYRALAQLEPGKSEWWNSLAYAEANLGRLPEAVAALEQYRKLAPNEPNVLDSLGEVHYMNRKFSAAAKYFDEQSQRFPTFQNGTGWRKAAFSYYFAGDLKTADLRFAEWSKLVLKSLPPSGQAFQRAMWLVRTKRQAAALDLLQKEIAGSTGDRKIAAELYLAMIEFGLDQKRPDLSSLRRWSTETQDGNARTAISVFALLAQPAPSLTALQARIEAAVPQPQLAALKSELLSAAEQIMSPSEPPRTKLFPLPNPLEGPLDALLLRSRLAVLP